VINVNFKFLNVVCKVNRFIILSFIVVFYSCNKEGLIIDNGEGITIEFLEGLNDNPQYQLTKDSNGYYEMELDRTKNQTIQRITGRLLRNGVPVVDISSGSQSKKVSF